MHVRRAHADRVRLPNGNVLIAGGIDCCDYTGPISAEIYNASTGRWHVTNAPEVPHSQTETIAMHNGRVLLPGGDNGICCTTAAAEEFNPVTQTWTRAQDMNVARDDPGIARLSNGKVLIAGGGNSDTLEALDSAEIYDPNRNTWTETPAMPSATRQPALVRLIDGRVLAIGGDSWTTGPSNQAAVFTPTQH